MVEPLHFTLKIVSKYGLDVLDKQILELKIYATNKE